MTVKDFMQNTIEDVFIQIEYTDGIYVVPYNPKYNELEVERSYMDEEGIITLYISFVNIETKLYRHKMRLYEGAGKFTDINEVRVEGKTLTGRNSYIFEGCDTSKLYLLFKDRYNGEYLAVI